MKEGLRTQFDFVLANDTLRKLREDSRKEQSKEANTDRSDDEDSNKGSSSDELEV
jgi:hypothetical protein